jgi:hypothetical protein
MISYLVNHNDLIFRITKIVNSSRTNIKMQVNTQIPSTYGEI